MKIRKATKKDMNKICELMQEYGKYENSLDNHVKFDSLKNIKKQEEKHMCLGTIYILAEENGIIGGVLNINVDKRGKENIGVLHTLIVTKEARGKGIGRNLVNYAYNYFKKKGCKRVRTFIHLKNKNAFSFWKKQGFETEAGFVATRVLR